MSSRRSLRVGDLIRNEISSMLVKGLKDPRIGFVTVTRVEVADDLRQAKVFFSVVGSGEDSERALSGLSSARGYIRSVLARRLDLKYVPELIFREDPAIKSGARLSELLNELKRGAAG